MRAWMACVGVLASCAAPARLGPAENEADLVARLVEARGGCDDDGAYVLRRRGPGRRPPLPSAGHSSIYTAERCGRTTTWQLDCDRRGCAVLDVPPLDTRVPSRLAAELVALQVPIRDDLGCERGDLEIQRRPRRDADEAIFAVRGCGTEQQYAVVCADTCRVLASGISSTELVADRARRDRLEAAGLRYGRCLPGTDIARLDPLGAHLDGKRLSDEMKSWARAYLAVPGVREVGFGLCCPSAERTIRDGWCLRLHVDTRQTVSFDELLDDVAAVPPATDGSRPILLLTVFGERGH